MCEDIRGSARIYEDERGYTRICEDLRGYARIYEDRRGRARIYEGASIHLPYICKCVISTICFSFAFWDQVITILKHLRVVLESFLSLLN